MKNEERIKSEKYSEELTPTKERVIRKKGSFIFIFEVDQTTSRDGWW